MPLYNYRAVDNNGKAVNGSLSARDELDVKRKVQENGQIAVKITKGSEISEKLNKLLAGKLSIKTVAMFCRQLYIIISSGVNILSGMEILKNQTRNKIMKNVLTKIYSQVQKGRSLSEAMSDLESMFPPLLINMVSVGEVSGNLDEILQNMAVYYEKESFMREKLKSAMIYPVILLVVAVAMMAFFMNFVLPEVAKLITDSGGELPVLTKLIIIAADFLGKYYLIIILGIVLLVAVLKTAIPGEKLRLIKDKLVMRIPIVNTSVRNVVTSRFMRTVSMMLKGGIPLLYVLESTEKVMNHSIAEVGIRAAQEGLKRGEGLGSNIASCNFFDPIVIHMIIIGEETGDLDNILGNMAEYYDKEAETWLMKMMATIEPVFTLIIGAFIGTLVISMMIPMFSMLTQIGTSR